MARIRTIKPEFFSSPSMQAVTDPWQRLLYIAMWCWADDHGIGVANPRELAGFAFPHDETIDSADIRRMLGGIRRAFGVEFYEVAGRRYYAIPSWEKHQKIDKRATRRNPTPDQGVSYDPAAGLASDSRADLQVPQSRREGEGDPAESARIPPSPRGDEVAGTEEQRNRGTEEDGTTSGRGVTEVDAGARASRDNQTDDRAAPAVEGAMPPDRCPLHRELATPPRCGRCADARRAQEAWKADRDAKVAQARAQAQAELTETRRLERQTIADCPRCDDRGVTPGGVRCTHDAAADRASPGRAAFHAERERLRQRAAAKTPAETSPRLASQAQRGKLITTLTERGITDRDAQIAWITDRTGRPITSRSELTAVEASRLIDQLEHPDPEPPDVDDPPSEVRDPGPDPEPDNEPQLDQPAWADEDQPDYAYAGAPGDPPF